MCSKDFEIRIFQNEEVISEITESDKVLPKLIALPSP
jgi:hypothetical protein